MKKNVPIGFPPLRSLTTWNRLSSSKSLTSGLGSLALLLSLVGSAQIFLIPTSVSAQDPNPTLTDQAIHSQLTMDEALKAAKERSSILQSAEEISKASDSSAAAAEAGLYPKLSLDGSYRRQSVVPSVNMGGTSMRLTDYDSYSMGPTLSYTIWDSGLRRNQIKSLDALAEAKRSQKNLTTAQVLLSTKMAYAMAALAAESLKNASEANELARTQNKDIQIKHREGSASRLEALASDSEVLNYDLKIQQAQSDWLASESDLNYFVGQRIQKPSQLQSIKDLVEIQKSPPKEINAEGHPQVQFQKNMEKSALAQATAQEAAYWPTLNLQLRTSLDYPNGPTFEQINQNSILLNFSWSLYEFGATKYQVAAKRAEAQAFSLQRNDALAVMNRDVEKTTARTRNLLLQVEAAEKLTAKQEELARLNYSAYKFGKLSFSEVQTANLRWLESKTHLASLRAQFLVQTFNLQYLMERE